MEDDRIILLNNAGEPVGEEDDLNLTDPTGPFLRSIYTFIYIQHKPGCLSWHVRAIRRPENPGGGTMLSKRG